LQPVFFMLVSEVWRSWVMARQDPQPEIRV